MKLLNLTLKYFKGIRDFTLDTNGGNVDLYGDNAVGKTTIADAMTWLLFDKDSQNRKDFQIKTLDASGQALHNLDHDVEGTLLVDNGKQVKLRKVYYEKYTKKRSSAQSVFSGNTTDYFIDGVPVKQSEYTAYVNQMFDESIFKLLTSPTYFNEQLTWQQRRAILLEICGDLTDEEVINSDTKLARLPKILNGHSLDDYKKIIAARRAKINDELKKIPIRIDEVTQGLPDISDLKDSDEINAQIETLTNRIRVKEQELNRVESGGAIAERQVELRKIEGELIDLKNQISGSIVEKADAKRQQISEIRGKIYDLKSKVSGMQRTQEDNLKAISELNNKRAALRDEWHKVNDRKFEFEQSNICPTCEQALPEEQIQAARDKAEAAFNLKKAADTDKINTKGREYKAIVERLTAETASLQASVEKLNDDIAQYEQKVLELQVELEALLHDADIYKEDPAYRKKQDEKSALEVKIADLKQDNESVKSEILHEILQLNTQKKDMDKAAARIDQYQKDKRRIAELEKQEKDLAAEYEKLEGELFLTEEFIRAKVSLLENRINSRFKMARFKLFETQVNGGLTECCEATYNGVPYGSGLNNGHKIAVGMDIINTLSDYYHFYPPVFIDNAESITVLPYMKAQVIRLIVSKPDKSLRVEIKETEEPNLFKEAI